MGVPAKPCKQVCVGDDCEGKSELDRILGKLIAINADFPMFVRHMNKNLKDNRAENLQWIHFADALEHLDFCVDWVMYLTWAEVRTVIRAVVLGGWQITTD